MKATSYNLIMSALYNGRKGARPPAGNPTSVICHGLMDAAGILPYEFVLITDINNESRLETYVVLAEPETRGVL